MDMNDRSKDILPESDQRGLGIGESVSFLINCRIPYSLIPWDGGCLGRLGMAGVRVRGDAFG